MDKKNINATAILSESMQFVRSNLKTTFIVAVLPLLLVTIVFGILESIFFVRVGSSEVAYQISTQNQSFGYAIFNAIRTFVIILVGTGVSYSLYEWLHNGKKPVFEDTFQAFKRPLITKVVTVAALVALVSVVLTMVAGIVVALLVSINNGSIAGFAVILGVAVLLLAIYVSLMLTQSLYLIKADNLVGNKLRPAIDYLRGSWNLMRKNFWSYFALIILMALFILGFVVAATLIIVLLIAIIGQVAGTILGSILALAALLAISVLFVPTYYVAGIKFFQQVSADEYGLTVKTSTKASNSRVVGKEDVEKITRKTTTKITAKRTTAAKKATETKKTTTKKRASSSSKTKK